jgi:RimJ/RimL family protein N-acetyltransferase
MEETTPDGRVFDVRPIEASDAPALLAGFEVLSERSRYRRFFSPMSHLSDAMLHYLTDVDHHDHEALVAFDRTSGQMVAVARYVRDRQHDPKAAEVAMTVADEWQGHGIGTRLMGRLAERAREENVERFTAFVLSNNHDMIDLLERLGPSRVLERQPGVVELEIRIAEDREPATA